MNRGPEVIPVATRATRKGLVLLVPIAPHRLWAVASNSRGSLTGLTPQVLRYLGRSHRPFKKTYLTLLSVCLRLSQFSHLTFMQYMGLCIQLTHLSYDDCENTCTLSYYHHQIGSMTHLLLLRVRSWNNGIHCISFYVLIVISFVPAHAQCIIVSLGIVSQSHRFCHFTPQTVVTVFSNQPHSWLIKTYQYNMFVHQFVG